MAEPGDTADGTPAAAASGDAATAGSGRPPSAADRAEDGGEDGGERSDGFKSGRQDADVSRVQSGARGRMSWNPVTDSGGSSRTDARPDAAATTPRSGFQFDLGSALARLGERGVHTAHEPAETADEGDQHGSASARVADPVPESAAIERSAEVVDPRPSRATDRSIAASVRPSERAEPRTGAARDHARDRPPDRSAEPAPPPTGAAGEQVRDRSPYHAADPADAPADAAPLPTRSRSSDPEPPAVDDPGLPRRRPQASSTAPPVPEIDEATSPSEPIRARRARPVFSDEAAAPQDPGVPSTTAAPFRAALPMSMASAGTLPTLPPATPTAPPPMVAQTDSGPATSDVQALRAAQLRASRQQRQGKVFGRLLIALLLIGALIAAALVFGRSYLFTAEWDPSLVSIVDAIQVERADEFDHAVAVFDESTDDYAATVVDLTVGDGWLDRVPEWRALGLVTGEPDVATVGAAIASLRPIVHAADDDTLHRWVEADPDVVAAEARVVLERVFARQLGEPVSGDPVDAVVGVTGVSPLASIAERAVDRFLAAGPASSRPAATGGTASGTPATGTPATTTEVPLPIVYEFAATERLGGAVLAAAGVDAEDLVVGPDYPEAVFRALDDAPVLAAGALLQPGDRPLADPVALGVDDWSLVLGARLPAGEVDRLVEVITADFYQVFERSGVTCFTGVFDTVDDAAGTSLLAALNLWVGASPSGAQALASPLGPDRAQLTACDPGAGAAPAPLPDAVDALIERQIARITP